MFSLGGAQGISAKQQDDTDRATEIECEINDLIAEHSSERAAIRALLHDLTVLTVDADQSAERGYRRSLFSHGVRPMATDDEP